MLKRLSVIFLVLIIAIYPVSVFADSTDDASETTDESSESISKSENEDTAKETDVKDEQGENETEDATTVDEESEDKDSEEQEDKSSVNEDEEAEAKSETTDNDDASKEDDASELQFEGNITGSHTFNQKAGNYELELTLSLESNMAWESADLYAGVELPEGVDVLSDTPDDVTPIDADDGSTALALKIPEKVGKSETITYTVPLLGQADEVITADDIQLYLIDENGFSTYGVTEGLIDVDFSDMDLVWNFNAESQIVKNFPDLTKDQFGLQFAFKAGNLLREDIERAEITFDVPDDITIYEPDSYSTGDTPEALQDFLSDDLSSDLDIDWDGNSAVIKLGDVEGFHGYEGFFTAFGESSQAVDDLAGLTVYVTLYQNGNEVAETEEVPFEVVTYESKDEESNHDDDAKGNNGNDSKKNENNPENQRNHEEGSGDQDDDGTIVPAHEDSGHGGNRLPDTATNNFSYMLLGGLLLISGGTLLFFRKRKLLK